MTVVLVLMAKITETTPDHKKRSHDPNLIYQHDEPLDSEQSTSLVTFLG